MPTFFPKTQDYSPRERIFRLLGLFAVFALVIWAFWSQNNQVINEIEKKQTVADPGNQLDQETKDFAQGFAKSLRQRYGLQFKLQIAGKERPLDVPDKDSKTMFMGIDPVEKRVVLQFPPLMSRALGQEFVDSLGQETYADYWEEGDWRLGLQMTLAAIWERLDQIEENS